MLPKKPCAEEKLIKMASKYVFIENIGGKSKFLQTRITLKFQKQSILNRFQCYVTSRNNRENYSTVPRKISISTPIFLSL